MVWETVDEISILGMNERPHAGFQDPSANEWQISTSLQWYYYPIFNSIFTIIMRFVCNRPNNFYSKKKKIFPEHLYCAVHNL